ncbi:hypothetical protein [Robertmurraya andreesenii]|uniref:Lipoprotein n=1 Tax=Anoxybacillus andreesenii TaxID=1325932 RepID=A0ABT9V9C3_9BACL|nr:hypothetical protein [Robertmurraya andreesenii]MDQ0157425.1 hypothetical protein [Robertmurraya andreesenii]
MKEKRVFCLLFLLILLTACKSDSLEDAIKTDIPFNMTKIIYAEQVEDGEIILYITEQKKETELIEALAVAFLKKDHKSRWENAGNNHWYYQENPNMTVYMNAFYDYDKKGKLLQKLPVIFGKIENGQIHSVQVAKEEGHFEEAQIIYGDNSRYFFKIGDYLLVNGLNSQGEIVEEYKKR